MPSLGQGGQARRTLDLNADARSGGPVKATPPLPLRATSIGLIARATSLHPPGAPEVDASRQPARRDRALSNSVATPGQAAVPDEAVGACSRSCRTSKLVPRSSAAAARRATVSDLDVALPSSPKRRRPDRGVRRPAMAEARPASGDGDALLLIGPSWCLDRRPEEGQLLPSPFWRARRRPAPSGRW